MERRFPLPDLRIPSVTEVASQRPETSHEDPLSALETALSALARINQQCPSATVERAMIDLRVEGFDRIDWPAAEPPATPAPPPVPDGALAEIHARDLNSSILASAVLNGGGLIVRELMEPGRAAAIREMIDAALRTRNEIFDAERPAGANRWYRRSDLIKGGPQQFFASSEAERNAEVGSLWAVDSPATAHAMIEFYREKGLREMLADCFGEPAVLSVKKWVLRKVKRKPGGDTGWHQDGRFLGDGIETINLWVSLSDCGGNRPAPGMEIVADHRKRIHPTGTHGATLDWTVGPDLVSELAPERPVLTPEFQPGDALFFDHYNLHRTQSDDRQLATRYAVESWFFAASRAPAKQRPLIF